MPNRPVKTYFLLAPQVKLVKIGKSRSPMRRMTMLRTMNAADVEILTVIDEDEGALHEMFKDLRHHGEWFRVDSRIAGYLGRIGEYEAAERLYVVLWPE